MTANSFIVSSHFYPNSNEVHHAILFLVPPALAAQAEAADTGGKGWTCFGETALPGATLAHIGETPWLSAWAPGHGEDVLPAGTGQPLPAGSLVVMQIHYNLLLGDKPVRAKLVLHTVPASTPLRPMSLALMPAPPDIPCPAGVTGPLCNRAASLADLGQRFGQSAIGFVEHPRSRSAAAIRPTPRPGTPRRAPGRFQQAGTIVRVGAHMHLLGQSLQIVLNPGTPDPEDPPRRHELQLPLPDGPTTWRQPVPVVPGDKLQVTCTYDPTLRQELPSLRDLPPRFVTWGDGSSDEMCLGLVMTVPPCRLAGGDRLAGAGRRWGVPSNPLTA